jgi:hypothetical protein
MRRYNVLVDRSRHGTALSMCDHGINLQIVVQSKEIERKPNPSFADDPPNRFVTRRLCCIDKQKIETPASRGTR